MSGKFHIPSTKEAKALSEGAASASQKREKKRKRSTLPNTRVMDDQAVAKMSTAEAASSLSMAPARTPPAFVSADSSSARYLRKTRSKSTKSEGMLTVSLPADGSTYLDPSFVKEVSEALLLPADRKRLT